jgi:hypothetical protein
MQHTNTTAPTVVLSTPQGCKPNLDHKERTASGCLRLKSDPERALIDWRTYMSRSADAAGPVYCNLWHKNGSGHGTATGYGYHKESAAIESALIHAGVMVFPSFGGVGQGATRAALIQAAQALDPTLPTDPAAYFFTR